MRSHLKGEGLPALARRIIASRQALGLSQLAFAKRCQISQPALSNYERATRQPDLPSGRAISRVLGAKLDWLYDGDRDSLPPALRQRIFGKTDWRAKARAAIATGKVRVSRAAQAQSLFGRGVKQ